MAQMGAALGFRSSAGFLGGVKSGTEGEQREESGTGTEKGRRGIRLRRTKGRSI